MTKKEILNKILEMYALAAERSYGEEITQLEHALQCYDLAISEEAPESLAVAAFLHDIGHLLDDDRAGDFGTPEHDGTGADLLLSWGFPLAITEPIRCHVLAKRYLVAMNPEYVWGLSEASIHTLHEQGGPFNNAQCQAFQQKPYFDDAIRLRMWDDHGKVVHAMRREVPAEIFQLIEKFLPDM